MPLPSDLPDNENWRSAMERRIIHIDDSFSKSISSLAQGQAATTSTLETVVRSLETLSNRINTPNNTNWVGIIGALVSVVLLMGAGVAMKVAPIEAIQQQNEQILANHSALLAARGEITGGLIAKAEGLKEHADELVTENHRQWKELTKLREDAAVAAYVIAHPYGVEPRP